MWHITIKFYNVNMWKLLGFLRVFMLINGSDGLLTVILSLMISRTHCLREHLGVPVSFPCPAISHYVWNNQKPNPSPLGFCHFLQPLPMEVKTVMVLLLSGWTLSAPILCAQHGGSNGNERACQAEGQSCICREGRKAMSETCCRKVTKGLVNHIRIFVS